MKTIIIFLLFISFTALAEDSYIVVTGQCTLKDTYRNEYGRIVNKDVVHSYISYPARFDTEKYTKGIAEDVYGAQLKKKHGKYKTGNFNLGAVSAKIFASKTEANKYYREFRKSEGGIKMNLSSIALKKRAGE